ncbi:NPCBM/NEW2 domain-containing protein [Streptomyces gelaticus]
MQSSTRIRTAAVAALLGLLAVLAGPGAAQAGAAEPDTTVGDLTGFSADGAVYHLKAGAAEARVSFVSAKTFRIELAPDGALSDPTGDDIVLPQGTPPPTRWKERSDRYGEVAFSVEADGKVLWTSPKVTGASATVPVDVKLARHVHLKVTDTDGSRTGDHGDWAAARFSCS